jgi:glycosyltransferase involved in cell wall biosynthesis
MSAQRGSAGSGQGGASFSTVLPAYGGAMHATPISVFVIAQNEAENIARCLQSVHDLSDDILVIDGGSEDGTQDIARNCGAKVIEHSWEGFAAQKNFALSQCGHDWVLTLDADEELSDTLRAELRKLLFQLPELWARENVGGWAMPRRVCYEGRWIRHGDWNPDYVVRLFRREGARYEGVVHESVFIEGQTRRLTGLIHHYSYRDSADHLARLEKYSTLWAQGKAAQGKRASVAAAAVRAAWRFVRGYILKAGFLDGKLGLRIAVLGARETWLKYRKLQLLNSRSTVDFDRT